MKVLVLKESLTFGGTEHAAANISKILDYDNDVLMTVFDSRNIVYDYGGKLVDFSLPPKKSYVGKALNTFLRHNALKRLIQQEKPEILYMFLSIGNWQTRMKYNGVIKVISARDFSALKKHLKLYHKAVSHSDVLICNSQYIREYYLSHFPMDREKVFSIYNAIDLDNIKLKANEEPEESFFEFLKLHPKVVVAVGRFCKEKGFEYLIEAIAMQNSCLGAVGLVLVGDGNYKRKYCNLIKNLNLCEDVYFTGFQNNPYKYMKRGDCFVLSSLSEGFPNVLVEAMSLGLPIIATNCFSGPAEILREDHDYLAVQEDYKLCDYGILTPCITQENNKKVVDELAEAIRMLLTSDGLRQKYSKLALIRAREYSLDVARVQLEKVFREIARRKR